MFSFCAPPLLCAALTHAHGRSIMGRRQQRAAVAAHPVATRGGLEKKKTKKTEAKMGTAASSNKNAAAGPPSATTAKPSAAVAAVVLPTRVAPPPPVYHLRKGPGAADAAADVDDSVADHPNRSYLTPSSSEYAECLRHSYRGFHVDQPSILEASFHDDVTDALDALVDAGYFHHDVLAAGKIVSPTFVQRTLVGERGMTYHYQKLRIFAHPWGDAETSEGSPLRVVRRLNEALRGRSRQLLCDSPDPRVGAGVTGSCNFNVTLINLMEPAHKCVAVPLKEEGQYGMGNTSVSWQGGSGGDFFSFLSCAFRFVPFFPCA